MNTNLPYTGRDGNISLCKRTIIADELNADILTDRGISALHYSIMYGNIAMVIYLIEEKGADIEAISPQTGHTAIHMAAAHGHVEILRYLIHERKANLFTTLHRGASVLELAVKRNHYDVVKVLLEETDLLLVTNVTRNLQANTLDREKLLRDAIELAALRGHLETLQYLLIMFRKLFIQATDDDEERRRRINHQFEDVVNAVYNATGLNSNQKFLITQALRGNNDQQGILEFLTSCISRL